jgi:hypothetical protein
MTTNYAAAWEAVVRDPRYLRNIAWGQPRSGHPEGTIEAHIHELESNLARMRPRLTDVEQAKLRLLVHVHDTLKPEALQGVAIAHPQSHASLARAFLAEFCDPADPEDADLLNMVQLHDEPYALWQQVRGKRSYSQNRADQLLSTIGDWELFTAFVIIDNSTAGKSREPLHWFFNEFADLKQKRWEIDALQ